MFVRNTTSLFQKLIASFFGVFVDFVVCVVSKNFFAFKSPTIVFSIACLVNPFQEKINPSFIFIRVGLFYLSYKLRA